MERRRDRRRDEQGVEEVSRVLAGEERDYTTGKVSRAVVVLAIPMVLEMAMESVFAVVDVFFVARLSPNAVATVGLTESVLTLVFALCMGLSAATTAMVARRIGEHDPEAAAVAAVQSILVGLGISLPITALVNQFYAEVQALGAGRQDTSALVRRLPRKGGK